MKCPIAGWEVAMFCPTCGTGNVDGSVFCNKCGNSLTTQVAHSLDATKPPPPPALTSRKSTPHGSDDANGAGADVKVPKAKASSPSYKRNRLLLLLLIVVIIGITVAHNSKKTNPNSATQTTVAVNTSSTTTTTAPATYSLVTVMPDRPGSGNRRCRPSTYPRTREVGFSDGRITAQTSEARAISS